MISKARIDEALNLAQRLSSAKIHPEPEAPEESDAAFDPDIHLFQEKSENYIDDIDVTEQWPGRGYFASPPEIPKVVTTPIPGEGDILPDENVFAERRLFSFWTDGSETVYWDPDEREWVDLATGQHYEVAAW